MTTAESISIYVGLGLIVLGVLCILLRHLPRPAFQPADTTAAAGGIGAVLGAIFDWIKKLPKGDQIYAGFIVVGLALVLIGSGAGDGNGDGDSTTTAPTTTTPTTTTP